MIWYCDIRLVSPYKRSWTCQNLKLKTPHSSEISVCANPVHDVRSQMIRKLTMCYLIVIFYIRITSIGSLRGRICVNKNFWNCSYFKRREENQLDATECFIALIICPTCFGHLYAHHQELETILVLLPHMMCSALFAGGRLKSRAAGYASGMRETVHNFRLYNDAQTNIHQMQLF